MPAAGGQKQAQSQPTTLGEFIQEYVRLNNISNRELAEKLETSHSIINKFSWHGLKTEYAGKDIGDPSWDLLVRMAIVTNTDICVLASLIAPQAVKPATRDALVLADRIARLDSNRQQVLMDFIRGALFQQGDQS